MSRDAGSRGSLPIRFNRPTQTGRELEHIQRAMASDNLSGDGEYTKRCQALLEEVLGIPKVLLTTSCTHALELSALLLDIQPGDEVILPPFTFVSTINAFALRGATPVFVDIRPDTLNLDENLLEARVSERTRAVLPIHYAGIGAAMDPILDLAQRFGFAVIEDNAHGLFGRYKNRWLGSLGELATLSFHETKNFTCGEGGALLINDPTLIARAEILREKGTNRSQFFRGEIDKYSWVDLGSSYLPSEILAAFLFPQLESWKSIQQRRRQLWLRYQAALGGWASQHGVTLPTVPADVEPSFHLFYLLLPTPDDRSRFLGFMKERQIKSVFHYVPLHTSTMGQKYGGRPGDYPVTEDLSARLARLPFYTGMTEEEQDLVIEAILDFSV
jgi:dTDP-4-amino-4,6-dideoxygalactose transaminase